MYEITIRTETKFTIWKKTHFFIVEHRLNRMEIFYKNHMIAHNRCEVSLDYRDDDRHRILPNFHMFLIRHDTAISVLQKQFIMNDETLGLRSKNDGCGHLPHVCGQYSAEFSNRHPPTSATFAQSILIESKHSRPKHCEM